MNDDAAVREAKERALQSLIGDYQVVIAELEKALEEKQFQLMKIAMLGQVFGDDDLSPDQKQMRTELPKEIISLQSRI